MNQKIYDQLALELPTHFIGKKIIFLKEVDSTNNHARKLFEREKGKVQEGTTIIADNQTKGRGQFNRQWHSAPGAGAYLTVVLTPPLALEKALPAISLMTGAAAVEALEGLLQTKFSLKYPNDIYWQGKKVGGILTESLGGGKNELKKLFVIVGIGVNLYADPSFLPEDVRKDACSLFVAGPGITPVDFIREFSISLEKCYEDFLNRNFIRIVDCWKERMHEIPEEAKGRLEGLVRQSARSERSDGVMEGLWFPGLPWESIPGGSASSVDH